MWQNVPALGADAYLTGSLTGDGSGNGAATCSGVSPHEQLDPDDVQRRQASAVRSELELANLAQATRLIGAWSHSSG